MKTEEEEEWSWLWGGDWEKGLGVGKIKVCGEEVSE